MPSGLPRFTAAFFQTPFVETEAGLVGLSPWQLRDHLRLGTWAKLNGAAKEVFGRSGNQKFTSAFGYRFELWARSMADEAAKLGQGLSDKLLPSLVGAEDEIEDVVFVAGNFAALISVKASLVPVDRLKAASSSEGFVQWFRKFLFEDRAAAQARGFRSGALVQLHQKVVKIRQGHYEHLGLARSATILPVLLTFDELVLDAGNLSKWIGEECAARNILPSTDGVMPLTFLAPHDFEFLLGLAARTVGICELLRAKVDGPLRHQATNSFLHERAGSDAAKLQRLPSTEEAFTKLVDVACRKLRENGIR